MDPGVDSLAIKHPGLSKSVLINKYLDIKIDSKSVDSISRLFTRKLALNQYGLIGYFQIDNISSGLHTLHINTIENEWIFTIPFWKE